MVHQLLRVKKRSDNSQHSVLESDASDNLYVNVADSVPISGTGVLGTEIPILVSPTGQLYIDNVNLVDEVTLVDNAKIYGVNANGEQKQLRTSLVGYQLQKPVQSSVQISDQATLTWENSAAQFTGKSYAFELPSGDISESYFVIVYNPSIVTDLNMYVQNEVVMGSSTKYAAIYDNTRTSGPIVVPKSTATLFTATAWSSCFTSIGGVLSDESGDINDANVVGDVPFTFGAANDAIYFGATMPFNRIRLNIATAGVYNATTVWEYWNGSAWTALTEVADSTNATTQDGTASFKRTGVNSITWYAPNNWASYDITGDPLARYWVRCRVATFTSRTTGPAILQGWYKAVGVPEVHAYLIKGVYGGDACRIDLQNATALGATDTFTAYIKIKRL